MASQGPLHGVHASGNKTMLLSDVLELLNNATEQQEEEVWVSGVLRAHNCAYEAFSVCVCVVYVCRNSFQLQSPSLCRGTLRCPPRMVGGRLESFEF